MRYSVFYLNAAFRVEKPGFFFARTKLDAYFACWDAHAKALYHLHRTRGGSSMARRRMSESMLKANVANATELQVSDNQLG